MPKKKQGYIYTSDIVDQTNTFDSRGPRWILKLHKSKNNTHDSSVMVFHAMAPFWAAGSPKKIVYLQFTPHPHFLIRHSAFTKSSIYREVTVILTFYCADDNDPFPNDASDPIVVELQGANDHFHRVGLSIACSA